MRKEVRNHLKNESPNNTKEGKMKPPPLFFIQATIFLLLAVFTMQQLTVANPLGNKTDYMALLAIKSQLIDHHSEGVLSSWNHSLHHCFWEGVICGRKHKGVIGLELYDRSLAGTISPFIGNMSFLRKIVLSSNSMYGQIPPEIGRLFRLKGLYLFNNSLSGGIPANISGCINLQNLSVPFNNLQGELPMGLGALSNLKQLWLNSNKLSGPLFKVIQNLTSLKLIYVDFNAFTGIVPDSVSKMTNLTLLSLSSNKFSGMIPPSIFNLSSLQIVDLSYNQLQGSIPDSISRMTNLTYLNITSNQLSDKIPPSISNFSSLQTLDLSNNQLHGELPMGLGVLSNLEQLYVGSNGFTGMIPSSIFNLSSLQSLDLSLNQLRGSIPPDIAFTLPQLQTLYLAANDLSGALPISLPNLTSLRKIELSLNSFTGSIPVHLGNLHNLQWINLQGNNFVGDINFISTLVNCTKLEHLDLQSNSFTGMSLQIVANLSTKLTWLGIGGNPISGEIPKGISNLINLIYIGMGASKLTGTIPQDLGKLHKLELLYLGSSRLTGEIPNSFGNLSRLSRLNLRYNQLHGGIPHSLGNCANLLYLFLSSNKFNGTLPNELFAKTNFIEIHLSNNYLEGSLPMEISKQINLKYLDISKNNFFGKIPNVFSSLPALQELYMGYNFFHGPIPPSFASLKNLLEVDLSQNNLSGTIPDYFSSFPLIYLNLSHNNFEGRVPTKGVFANASAISLVDNSRLCGGIFELHLSKCVEKDRKKRRMSCALKSTIIPIICVFVGVLAMVTCIWLYLKGHSKKRKSTTPPDALAKESFLKLSYGMLFKATDGFSPESLLGSGTFGFVFKGILDGKAVAVKVLNLQQRGGAKSFLAECEALRNIRHRNLVGILTACSSMDFQRNDIKAIVYEFMPNGSLYRWLHEDGNLSLLQRVDIAIDVAHALNYLHHECGNPIVHCDLKPSNILLDHDMVARVSDFGLAKVLAQPLHPNQSSSIGVRGTVGYTAPEYGLGGEASPEADLYSYGILLLELMTRKTPTDNMFKEDFNLHMYVKAALPDQVLQIVDKTLIANKSEEVDDRVLTEATFQQQVECMVSVMKIGVSCSHEFPQHRMKISDTLRGLQLAKNIISNTRRRARQTGMR